VSYLRKSVWGIVNDGIGTGAGLSILHPERSELYTPDVQLWAVIRAAVDVDGTKLCRKFRAPVFLVRGNLELFGSPRVQDERSESIIY